jgi:hypothetical protein
MLHTHPRPICRGKGGHAIAKDSSRAVTAQQIADVVNPAATIRQLVGKRRISPNALARLVNDFLAARPIG